MTTEDEKYDGILNQILSEKQGYEGFFESMFSFLRRKSDFFADSKRGEQTVAKVGKEQADTYFRNKRAEEQEKKAREEKKKAASTDKPQAASPSAAAEASKTPNEEPQKEEKSDGKLAPNKGNGSSTEAYYWTQTLEEVTAHIPLANEDSKKSLDVDLGNSHCRIARKDGSKVYIDDDWCNKIHIDESSWVIVNDNNGKSLQLTLLKWKNDTLWWDCLVKSEPKIDTQKVNPEPGKLSDLDGEARTTVEKMMFDMRQKQMGLPSSDELEKREKLKDFMKAHPELDFSNAKFS